MLYMLPQAVGELNHRTGRDLYSFRDYGKEYMVFADQPVM